jgi:sulfotransferase family protein
MTLDPTYFELLHHLGRTTTVGQLAASDPSVSLVALRHDVDHNLDYALEMAFWEARAGCRATYFLLNTAAYWDDADFDLKVRQLADFGHEVGLHINSLAAWYRGLTNAPSADLEAALKRLRGCGVPVTGVAAHGDKACYAGGFTNFWLFGDLAPWRGREDGISAEGIRVDDPMHQIPLPADATIRRGDGASVHLWSLRLADFGVDYVASHIPFDLYFSDSGGSWIWTPDPRTVPELHRTRAQVLVHPIHWRAPPRRWFFLSTARSGSTWLAHMLERASSARGLHEFTLNHRFDGAALRPDKRTSDQVDLLFADDGLVERLMRESHEWTSSLEADVAEANVYLVHALSTLQKVFPDATLVHLCRNPHDVVRSLLKRRWYETLHDTAHPRVPMADWETGSQLDRAAAYVVWTNEQLLAARLPRLQLEQLTVAPEAFADAMAGLGIAFYPRLVRDSFGQAVNVGTSDDVPPVRAWAPGERERLAARLGQLPARLGYGPSAESGAVGHGPSADSGTGRALPSLPRPAIARIRKVRTVATYRLGPGELALLASEMLSGHLHRAKAKPDRIIFPPHVNSIVFLSPRLMQRSYVRRLSRALGPGKRPNSACPARVRWRWAEPDTTWSAPATTHLRVSVSAVPTTADVRLFVLSYRTDAKLVEARPLFRLRPDQRTAEAEVALRPFTTRFRLALHATAPERPVELTFDRLALEITRPIYA